MSSCPPPWPHAPPHWTLQGGSYFVTASTFHRQRIFDSTEKLDVVTGTLIDVAKEFGWQLRCWAVFANHYHLFADSPAGSGETLRILLSELHRRAAIEVNRLSESPGRRVWMNFRETHITHQVSYLARLRYVNENPVKHRLVEQARDYKWCSAAWFETNAPKAFVESVRRFRTDRLKIWDDFDE
jgi:putative transposase